MLERMTTGKEKDSRLSTHVCFTVNLSYGEWLMKYWAEREELHLISAEAPDTLGILMPRFHNAYLDLNLKMKWEL